MKRVLMMKGANKLVTMCTNVKPGEKVLIITDFNADMDVSEVIAAAAIERGAEVVLITIIPGKSHSGEPPNFLADTLKKADVIFTPVSKSISHTTAIKNARKAGARVIILPQITSESLMYGGIETNFVVQKDICSKISEILTQANYFEVRTSNGTRLKGNIEGRKGQSLNGLALKPGDFSPCPVIESCLAPVEGTTEGIIIVDGAITGVGLCYEPVRVKVEKGFIESIEGGKEAKEFKRILEEAGDKNSYNISEFSIGLNPKSTKLKGNMMDDLGIFGSIHIGTGDSINLGGEINANSHLDLVILDASVKIDGKLILENRKLLI